MVGSNILAALVRVSATYRNKIKFQDLITLYAYSFDNSTVSVPCLIVRSFVPSSIQYFLTTPVYGREPCYMMYYSGMKRVFKRVGVYHTTSFYVKIQIYKYAQE